VRLKSLLDAWNSFFFAPQSPLPIALFRILYGLLVIITLLLLWPDWLTWYGPHAWVSLSTMHALESGPRLNLFTIIPQNDVWIEVLFWYLIGVPNGRLIHPSITCCISLPHLNPTTKSLHHKRWRHIPQIGRIFDLRSSRSRFSVDR
jgi:hypothetical protein